MRHQVALPVLEAAFGMGASYERTAAPPSVYFSPNGGANPVSTRRRVQYALGYLELGLLTEASEELEAAAFRDRFDPLVMRVRLELHTRAGQWDVVENFARVLLAKDRADVTAWVSLGCALRRTKTLTSARDVLLEAETTLGTDHAIIHYNLACYHCPLGAVEAARDQLAIACRLNPDYKKSAIDDPDLKGMWDAIGAIE